MPPIERLLQAADVKPRRVVDIGCGDGSLVYEMSQRDLGASFVAYEISPAAVEFVQSRNIAALERADLFDGAKVPDDDKAFDLALLNFVLEHTNDPSVLLGEASRVAHNVLVSIVLDDTILAERAGHRRGVELAGRTQRYNRDSARALLRAAGLEVQEELISPPRVAVSVYWAKGLAGKTKAYGSAIAKTALHRVLAQPAERLFAASYRAIARSADATESPF